MSPRTLFIITRPKGKKFVVIELCAVRDTVSHGSGRPPTITPGGCRKVNTSPRLKGAGKMRELTKFLEALAKVIYAVAVLINSIKKK